MHAESFPPKSPALTRTELDTAVDLWLALESASACGDREARAFASGTFGPWTSGIIQAQGS